MDDETAKKILVIIDDVCLFSDADIADRIAAELERQLPAFQWTAILKQLREE